MAATKHWLRWHDCKSTPVGDCLNDIENQKFLPFFDSNGNSTIKGAIMRKPK